MLSLDTVPDNANQFVFLGGNPSEQIWHKPANISMIAFLAVGGGGAGGGGGTTGSGGGGAGGNYGFYIVPSFFVPPTIRITVGSGGRANGAAGTSTFFRGSSNNVQWTLATGGGGGTISAAGVPGALPASSTNFGLTVFSRTIQGTAGGNGGFTPTNGVNSTYNFGSGGGGGSDSTTLTSGQGGMFPMTGAHLLVSSPLGVPSNTSGQAAPSPNGFTVYLRDLGVSFSSGGAGGGFSGGGTVGTVGGGGGLGCGGGGGGGADFGFQRGNGGFGGNGLLKIWCW